MAPKRKIAEAINDDHEARAAALKKSKMAPETHIPSCSGKAVLRSGILDMLGSRRSGATCCPSEIPRRHFPSTWRERMEDTRQAAFELADEGVIEITQQGEVIDYRQPIKGPIRLRLKAPPPPQF